MMPVTEQRSASLSKKLSHTVGHIVTSGMELLAQMPFGQSIIKLLDRFLWTIEKSTQWSLPVQEVVGEENGKTFGKVELVRPLPWILFLPMLIILRTFRFCINIAAFLLGFPQIQPSDVIKFMQNNRRRLRTIKCNGIKVMRSRQDEISGMDKDEVTKDTKGKILSSVRFIISGFFCMTESRKSPSPSPTRIRVGDIKQAPATKDKSSNTVESGAFNTGEVNNKRKFNDSVSTNESTAEDSEAETLMEKIDRLALENSSSDSDFNPYDCPASETSSEGEVEESVPKNELEELKVEKDLLIEELTSQPIPVKDTPPTDTPSKDTPPKPNANVNIAFEKTDARPGWVVSVGQEYYYSPEKYELDGETTFYSPISSKSVSPERSSTPNKQGQSSGEYDAISENIENGDSAYVAQFVDLDKTICSDDGTNDNVTNGRNEEKRHGKGGKSHHRNKRSNCASRKKK